MNEPKQVIVIRKDLNMRKGKMVAQGAHASMKAVIDPGFIQATDGPEDYFCIPLTLELEQWLSGSFVKITVSVDSEKELLGIYDAAQNANVPRAIIKDQGRTEFNGTPTYTAVAIGPGDPEVIDKITGHLKLL